MDPLSIVASTFSLVGAIGKTGVIIRDFAKNAAETKSELDHISGELESLEATMVSINTMLVRVPLGAVPDTLRTLPEIVAQCTEVVGNIGALVSKFNDDKAFSAAKWALCGQKDVAKEQLALGRHKSAINMALSVLDLAVSTQIKQDTEMLLEDTEVLREDTGAILHDTRGISRKLDQLTLQLRESQAHASDGADGKDLLMQRFIDDVSNYAQTTYQESVLDASEYGPNAGGGAPARRIPRHVSAVIEEIDPIKGPEPEPSGPAATEISISKTTADFPVDNVLWDEQVVSQGEAKRESLSREQRRTLDLALRVINAQTAPEYIRNLVLQGASPITMYKGKKEFAKRLQTLGDTIDCGPLFWAVWYQNNACLEALLSYGADANPHFVGPATLLAVIMGNVTAVRLFAAAGISFCRLDVSPDRQRPPDEGGKTWWDFLPFINETNRFPSQSFFATHAGLHTIAAIFAGGARCMDSLHKLVLELAKGTRESVMHSTGVLQTPVDDAPLEDRLQIMDIIFKDRRAATVTELYGMHLDHLADLLHNAVYYWGRHGDEDDSLRRVDTLLRWGAFVEVGTTEDEVILEGCKLQEFRTKRLAEFDKELQPIPQAIRSGHVQLFWKLFHSHWPSRTKISSLDETFCAYAALLGRDEIVEGLLQHPIVSAVHRLVELWTLYIVTIKDFSMAARILKRLKLTPSYRTERAFIPKGKVRFWNRHKTWKYEVFREVSATELAARVYLTPEHLKAAEEGRVATRKEVVQLLQDWDRGSS